ncbi:hypothetical protein GGR55DRAFT_676538 [Xylaria sp. FL0064]|nr:hypothetical protein GGR55DRAFT_676538 [Xylaria sp. FL0064]
MPLDRKPTLTSVLQCLLASETDHRTDAEIDICLSTRWCKWNVIGWVQRLGPDWDVRAACTGMVDGWPNYALNFIGADHLPDCFDKTLRPERRPARHASNMARLPLVYIVSWHGWLEQKGVDTFLFGGFDASFQNLLENLECLYEMLGTNFYYRLYEGMSTNGSIEAHKNSPFLKRLQRVFLEIWKSRTDCVDLGYRPLIRHLILPESTTADGIGSKESAAPSIAGYFSQGYFFERVHPVVGAAEDWNELAYHFEHISFSNAERDYWKLATLMPTEVHIKLVLLPFKAELTRESKWNHLSGQLLGAAEVAATTNPQEGRLQRAARDWLTYTSSSCLAAKRSSSYWWSGSVRAAPLAVTWALADHEDDDIMLETRAGWLRYASTHLRHTPKVQIYGSHCPGSDHSSVLGFLGAEAERVLNAGLLEPALDSGDWELIPPFETIL